MVSSEVLGRDAGKLAVDVSHSSQYSPSHTMQTFYGREAEGGDE